MKRMTTKLMFSGVLSVAAAASMVVGAAAQTPAQSGAQASPSKMAAESDQITVTGCVQREADYRQAKDAGKGGVAGTGVGAGNEFVLINASISKEAAGGAVGTSGSSGAYELSGSNEGQVGSFINKRVEITGTLKPAETNAAGRPTGGATAGEPPHGVDATSKDLKLREIDVASVKEASGSCPAGK